MPLTEVQEKALESLDWLLDNRQHRQEGRTTVFAIALIRAALREPGQYVEVSTLTYPENNAVKRVLWDTLCELVERGGLRDIIQVDRRRDYIRSSFRDPILDWMPPLPDRTLIVPERPRVMEGRGKTAWEHLVSD